MRDLRCRVGIHAYRPASRIYLGLHLSKKLPPSSLWTHRCRRCQLTRHQIRFHRGNQ